MNRRSGSHRSWSGPSSRSSGRSTRRAASPCCWSSRTRVSPSTFRAPHTCSRSDAWPHTATAPSSRATSPSGVHTWATDAGISPAGRQRPRGRRHLREPRAGAGPHLQRDGPGQLRPGRDGDAGDIRRIRTGQSRHELLDRVPRGARARVRWRHRHPADRHPPGRAGADPDPGHHHARPGDALERPGGFCLRLRAPLVSKPLLGSERRRARRFRQLSRPRGDRDVWPGVARRLPVASAHHGRTDDARRRPSPGGKPSARSAGQLDAGARLGISFGGGSRVRDHGRPDPAARAEHDAVDHHLRLRRGGPRRNREPAGGGGGRLGRRRDHQSRGCLSALCGRRPPASGRPGDHHRRPHHPSQRTLRASRGPPSLMLQRIRTAPPRYWLVAIVVIFFVGFPTVISSFQTSLWTQALVLAIAIMGLNILVGYSGQLSLAQDAFATVTGTVMTSDQWIYYVALFCALLLFWVAWNLVRHRPGRAMRAIRDGEVAAAASGVNIAGYKTMAFGISAFYAGTAGSLFGLATGFVSPDTFPVSLSIQLLVGAVVGGLASIPGPLLGAIFAYFLPIESNQWVPSQAWIPAQIASTVKNAGPAVSYGVVLIAIMMFAPNGIVGLVNSGYVALNRRLRGGGDGEPGKMPPDAQIFKIAVH